MGSTFRRRVNPLARQEPRPTEDVPLRRPRPPRSAPTPTPPPKQRIPPLAYSVSSAAEALGLSEYSVYELVRANRLPHVRVGRRILIPSKLLEAWLATAG